MKNLSTSDLLALIAVIISALAVIFSIWLGLRTKKDSLKPVLVFEYNQSDGWYIRNVGNGPALNILVANKRIKGGWFNPVRIPALAVDAEFHLAYLGHFNDSGLGTSFSDFSGSMYSTIAQNDLSRTYERNALPNWSESEIAKYWNHFQYHISKFDPKDDKFK